MQTISISIPTPLRSRFLTYGPRATSASTSTSSAPPSAQNPSDESKGFLDYLATWQVPHSYFTHFYVASVLSSVFWVVQLLSRGVMFQAITSRVSEEHQRRSMSLTQLVICCALLAVQGSRRLWESFIFSKPSSSQMWFMHWLLGLGFYLAAGVAIWIEGSGALLTNKLNIAHLQMTNAPSLRTFVLIPLFLVASGLQHDSHHYLFSLKKIHPPGASYVPRGLSVPTTAQSALSISRWRCWLPRKVNWSTKLCCLVWLSSQSTWVSRLEIPNSGMRKSLAKTRCRTGGL